MAGAFARLDAGRSPARRAARPCPATSCRATCRASATPTTSSTARPRRAACCFGGYEPDPVARWLDGVPWEHAASPLPPDTRPASRRCLQGAIRRFPFLERRGRRQARLPPRRDDARRQPAARADARRARVLGRRRALAQRVRRRRRDRPGARRAGSPAASPSSTCTSYRPWRFGAVHRDPLFAAEPAREAYRYYYRLRYPFDTRRVRGRPRRTSALHGRLQDARRGVRRPRTAGSGPTTSSPGSRGGARAPTSARSAGRGRRSSTAARRGARAFRERVGHHRHDVVRQDRGRPARARRRCSSASATTASTGRPGSVVYTQFLNERGGHRRRRHRHAARRGALPRRHRRRRRRLRPRLAAPALRDGDGRAAARDRRDELP